MAKPKPLLIAAASFEIQVMPDSSRIQLLPYGEFRAIDGRPFDAPAWFLTEENGHDVARLANSAANELVIDYEHQTVNKEKNGQPAPAAGWMRWFEFTVKGLFAEASWTDKAQQMIDAKEYRYISAVFSYDTAGYVRKIYHAGLTNSPALDGMDEILAAASAKFLTPDLNTNEETNMKLLELLRQAFKTPNATEEELTAALSALVAKQPETVALTAVFDELQAKESQIAVLSVQTPDPAQFVPVATMQNLQNQLATLSAQVQQDKSSALIQAALEGGKLLPAQKAWAEGLAQTEGGLASLTTYLNTVAPTAALGGVQTQGNQADAKTAALSAEECHAAKALGMSEAEFLSVKEGN